MAGVAALVENVDPDADPALVKDTLMRSVGDTRTPGLIPVSVSGGRVNAARAVDARGTPPLSPNGPGGPWVTCDPDHDGVVLNLDMCPDLYGRGTLDGCPDADADGVNDSRDNCTSTPNSAQADDDGDRLGNACDPTPRGEDPDGDRKPNLDDACPTVYGTLANGCPEPITPQPDGARRAPRRRPRLALGPSAAVVRVDVKVTPKKCPRGRKTCAKVGEGDRPADALGDRVAALRAARQARAPDGLEGATAPAR